MVDTFNYRPKFVDIRVNKAGKAKPAAKDRAATDKPCDQIGCKHAGAHRAPKARGREHEYWWFCAEHVAEYNRRWNYFDGMSDTELKDYESAERSGHRPTWTFRAARGDRLSAATKGLKGKRSDPLNILGSEPEKPEPRHRHLGRLQLAALEVLHLDERADGEAVRARYAELVKRYHPDSNGGDRTAEAHLHKVIRAYQTLKTSGLV